MLDGTSKRLYSITPRDRTIKMKSRVLCTLLQALDLFVTLSLILTRRFHCTSRDDDELLLSLSAI